MIGRYLYVHSPALKLTLAPHIAETGLRFTYEVTEQGVPYVLQGYELSMAIVVRILRLLGGPEARPSAISFMHDQQGPDAAYREALGFPVRFRETWCGSRYPNGWPREGQQRKAVTRPSLPVVGLRADQAVSACSTRQWPVSEYTRAM